MPVSAEGRVEHQKLNQTAALLLSFGWVFGVQLDLLKKNDSYTRFSALGGVPPTRGTGFLPSKQNEIYYFTQFDPGHFQLGHKQAPWVTNIKDLSIFNLNFEGKDHIMWATVSFEDCKNIQDLPTLKWTGYITTKTKKFVHLHIAIWNGNNCSSPPHRPKENTHSRWYEEKQVCWN